jgi:hypothetical protein
VSTACREGDLREEGKPGVSEGNFNTVKGWWLAWVSERVIVALKPGNSGGAKDLTSDMLAEVAKEEVIDDESRNTH